MGWERAKLREIAGRITDGEHITPRRTAEGFLLLSARNIQNGHLALENVDHVPAEEYERITKRCNPTEGDILISCSGSVGRICRVPANLKFTLVRSVALVKLDSQRFSSGFYVYQLQSPSLQKQIEKGKKATAQANLFLGPIGNLEILLCPLLEQHAIVSKLEQLFSELDKGIESLKTAQQQLKVYRQSVLKWAFEGKLTAEWRKNQKLPDAAELLAQIQKEREAKAKASGKKLKAVEPLTPEELGELPELPEGWCWVRLGEACEKIFDGTHFSPKNTPVGEFKYVTAKNIKEHGIILDDITYLTATDHKAIYARCDVRKGDVLYIKDGATTGVATVNTLEEEFSLLSSVGVFRVNQQHVVPKFLAQYLNAGVTRHRMLAHIAGVAITRLTLTKLNHSVLALAPFAEQVVIVSAIESRLSVCDDLERNIVAALGHSEALRQSILKKAFEGKLLDERELDTLRKDPAWESADKLLERIREERERGVNGRERTGVREGRAQPKGKSG